MSQPKNQLKNCSFCGKELIWFSQVKFCSIQCANIVNNPIRNIELREKWAKAKKLKELAKIDKANRK